MGVDHGRADIPMTKQLLDRTDVVTGFQKVGGKGMTEDVASHPLGEARLAGSFRNGSLQNRLMNVMPSLFAGPSVSPASLLRGNTHCQSRSLAAFGYLRSRAVGNETRPQPSARSRAWVCFTNTKCCRKGSFI